MHFFRNVNWERVISFVLSLLTVVFIIAVCFGPIGHKSWAVLNMAEKTFLGVGTAISVLFYGWIMAGMDMKRDFYSD